MLGGSMGVLTERPGRTRSKKVLSAKGLLLKQSSLLPPLLLTSNFQNYREFLLKPSHLCQWDLCHLSVCLSFKLPVRLI